METKHVPLEPTAEMIDEGAQRLVRWDDDCVWPDSWSALDVAAARNEAERVWRSMWLAAYSRGQTLKGNEMTSICENEHCAYHRPLPVKDAGAPYVDTVEDGERVRVERHLYRSRDGKRDFFLCDVCNAAVQMVVTPNV